MLLVAGGVGHADEEFTRARIACGDHATEAALFVDPQSAALLVRAVATPAALDEERLDRRAIEDRRNRGGVGGDWLLLGDRRRGRGRRRLLDRHPRRAPFDPVVDRGDLRLAQRLPVGGHDVEVIRGKRNAIVERAVVGDLPHDDRLRARLVEEIVRSIEAELPLLFFFAVTADAVLLEGRPDDFLEELFRRARIARLALRLLRMGGGEPVVEEAVEEAGLGGVGKFTGGPRDAVGDPLSERGDLLRGERGTLVGGRHPLFFELGLDEEDQVARLRVAGDHDRLRGEGVGAVVEAEVPLLFRGTVTLDAAVAEDRPDGSDEVLLFRRAVLFRDGGDRLDLFALFEDRDDRLLDVPLAPTQLAPEVTDRPDDRQAEDRDRAVGARRVVAATRQRRERREHRESDPSPTVEEERLAVGVVFGERPTGDRAHHRREGTDADEDQRLATGAASATPFDELEDARDHEERDGEVHDQRVELPDEAPESIEIEGECEHSVPSGRGGPRRGFGDLVRLLIPRAIGNGVAERVGRQTGAPSSRRAAITSSTGRPTTLSIEPRTAATNAPPFSWIA